MVDAMITNQLLPEIGREFLNRLMNSAQINRVHIGADKDNFTFSFD
jgi:type VI secretion system protein VasG